MYEEGAPHVAQGVWDIIRERKVPLLGICYGMQVRASFVDMSCGHDVMCSVALNS